MQPTGLAIGEVARRAGIRPSAIRYYERIGLMPEPERVSGRRRYDESVLRHLAVIDLARRAGFTLAETRTLCSGFASSPAPSERWRALARRKLVEVEALIERGREMKRLLELGLECDCLRLDDCRLIDSDPERRRAPDAAEDLPAAPTAGTAP